MKPIDKIRKVADGDFEDWDAELMGMSKREFLRRLTKLSPPARYDLTAIHIALDRRTPYSKLQRPRLADFIARLFVP